MHFTIQFDKELTLDAARVLVQGGADIEAVAINRVTPLYLTVQAKRDVVELLLEEGPKQMELRTVRDASPLEKAIASSDLDMIELLLKYGTRTETVDNKGLGVVHVAAMQSDVDVMKRILETMSVRFTWPPTMTMRRLLCCFWIEERSHKPML